MSWAIPTRRIASKPRRLLAGSTGAARTCRIETSFQSRFGRAKWLEPATDAVLEAEAKAGTKRLAVAAPGFAVDCLETLEELAIRGKEQFVAAGGEALRLRSPASTRASRRDGRCSKALVRRELAGWI